MGSSRRHVARKLSLPVAVVLASWFVGGLVLAVGATLHDIDVNPAIHLPWPGEAAVGAMISGGALLAVLSTMHWRRESTNWRLELLAHPILTTAWMLYGLLVFLSDPTSLFPQALAGGFAAASALRMIEVIRHIEWTRANIEHYHRMMEEGPNDVA